MVFWFIMLFFYSLNVVGVVYWSDKSICFMIMCFCVYCYYRFGEWRGLDFCSYGRMGWFIFCNFKYIFLFLGYVWICNGVFNWVKFIL